jgi:hypothetical protein
VKPKLPDGWIEFAPGCLAERDDDSIELHRAKTGLIAVTPGGEAIAIPLAAIRYLYPEQEQAAGELLNLAELLVSDPKPDLVSQFLDALTEYRKGIES